jgi:hypothetical protein
MTTYSRLHIFTTLKGLELERRDIEFEQAKSVALRLARRRCERILVWNGRHEIIWTERAPWD